MDDAEKLVERARAGDRDALESLVRTTQDDVFGLAMRFLGHPENAEDASQEILVRVVTNLRSFKGGSRFRTWVFRVAVNHLLNYRRSLRRAELPIEEARRMLAAAVDASREAATVEDDLQVREMKLACAHGMLMCLDRDHRMAYVLGVLFELSGDEASEVLEISKASYRKRLQRARKRMREYFSPLCGLVSEANPCRCDRMVTIGARAGIMDPSRLAYAPVVHRLSDATSALMETPELLRDELPRPKQDFVGTLRDLLARVPGLSESSRDRRFHE